MNKKQSKTYDRVMSRVYNKSRTSLGLNSVVMRHQNPSSVCVGAKPSTSTVSSAAFNELPTVLNDYVPENNVQKPESSVRMSKLVKPRRTLKSLDTSKSPPRTVTKSRCTPVSRIIRAKESTPALKVIDDWSDSHVRQCYSSRSHTRLKDLKDEIKAYRDTEKFLQWRSDMYKKCGVVFDDDGNVASDKAVQVQLEKEMNPEELRFPVDPDISERWTAILRLSREENWWTPGKRSVICSAHFNDSDLYTTIGGLKRLRKEAVPQKALFLSSTPSDNISNNSTVTTEPSTSAPVVVSNNSVVTAELSTSASVVNSNNSVVTAKPSTSAPVVNSNKSVVTAEQSTPDEVVNSNKIVATAKPSTSAPIVNSNNSAITAKPSTSAPIVNSNNSAITAEPSTSAPVVNSNNSVVTAKPSASVSVVNSNNSVVTAKLSTSAPVFNSNNSVVTAEPSTSAPVVISNSVVTVKPSTSAPVVNSNNSVVTAERSTSAPVVEETILATCYETEQLDVFPDIDYIIQSPRIIRLKKELHRKSVLQLKHGRIIKTLREKIRRSKKANCNLKNIIKSLKHERFIKMNNILSKNDFAADLFNIIYKKHKNQTLPTYTNEIKKFCLTLNFHSPSAYNYVRSKFGTCLPHPKTLSKWYRNIDSAPGLTEEGNSQ